MKLAVCVPPGPCDCYGHHSHYAERLTQIGAARGLDVEILRYKDSNFYANLFANLARKDCVVHFHSFLYDLTVKTFTVPPRLEHAVEKAEAITLATVSDHPFSDIMKNMVINAHPRTRFMVVDNTFPDEMRFINPNLGAARFWYTPYVAPVNYDESIFKPYKERDYDLVLPMLVVDRSMININELLAGYPDGWMKTTARRVYDIAMTDVFRNPFHIFGACAREVLGGTTLEDIKTHQPKALDPILQMMDAVDGRVRHMRRHRMVQSLLRDVGELKVAVMADPVPSLQADPKVEFLGVCKTDKATPLMANSRAILNCNPTYPTNIHERISVGMMYESCVITDVNTSIESTFRPADLIAYSPQSNMTIAEIFHHYDVAAIAKSASKRIRELPGFSWDAHFDDVMLAAAA